MSVELLRLYEPCDLAPGGYPLPWEKPVAGVRIPDLVRELAGHRCVRCGHPYRTKQSEPEWSPCDDRCTHGGPIRALALGDEWQTYEDDDEVAIVMATVARGRIHARWRVLTVHHLTGDKADCRWWNLAALCQRCHLYVQGRVKMDQVYPFEHTPWFRPYAAGYYAWTYLNEQLTREQVDGRLEELLALERAG